MDSAVSATVTEASVSPRPQYDSGLQVVSENRGDKIAYAGPTSGYQGPGVPHYMFGGEEGVKERRICGMRRSTLVLTVVGTFLFIGLVLIAALFGTKIADLESSRGITSGSGSSGESPSQTDNTGGTPTSAAPASPTETDINVDGYTYEGCYQDGSDRVLAETRQTSDAMTNSQCAQFCSRYKYFGTQFGSQCYCGNELVFDRPANPWNCNDHCGGASSTAEICGGFFFLSLWMKS